MEIYLATFVFKICQWFHSVLDNTVEPGYNDMGFIRHLAYRVRYYVVKINSLLRTVTLYTSVITTQNIQSMTL